MPNFLRRFDRDDVRDLCRRNGLFLTDDKTVVFPDQSFVFLSDSWDSNYRVVLNIVRNMQTEAVR